ncbi:glycine betaine/proline transport system substrate-binding protein [Roseibium hamelinense]|uniref:Glycine betaine/proline transport system substrate-binding protein n=1 Tax=Roseibium hamelinense TaxID=150831 RepID=A0A562TC36_9HYPH|nr:glycine betaine ABC transporter substrate-binding protein [Roseibium hamelinense]MTI42223.1 amino acid-binding protein [Roseibium hamelinense]TWI90560.1 glycine betaine/proline transport system substrate-binding protein [Roseibium hamelinense]
MTRFLQLLRASCFGVCLSGTGVAAEPVVIGVPAWPSAQVTAHILSATLQDELGVETELREQGTMTILGGIGSGKVHIHPEIWLPNLEASVDRLSAEPAKLVLGQHGVAASQNVCTTHQTRQETGLTSVSDLTNPDIAARFDTDGDGKGEIWIGAPTWSSTEIERIRARSYGYDQTMTLLEMPEQVAMAAVDAAAALGKPIVFYCYGPHHVFDLHDVVMLDEPAHDSDRWTIVKRADDPDWLTKSRADTAWDEGRFHIGFAASLGQDMPAVATFLNAVKLTASDATTMSYAVEVEGKPADQVAQEWIAANKSRLEEWTK